MRRAAWVRLRRGAGVPGFGVEADVDAGPGDHRRRHVDVGNAVDDEVLDLLRLAQLRRGLRGRPSLEGVRQDRAVRAHHLHIRQARLLLDRGDRRAHGAVGHLHQRGSQGRGDGLAARDRLLLEDAAEVEVVAQPGGQRQRNQRHHHQGGNLDLQRPALARCTVFRVHVRLSLQSSRMAGPMLSSGRSPRDAPQACAACGMPKTTELCSSWAYVAPPARLSSSRPCAPSSPMPVSTNPAAREPYARASETSSLLPEGQCRPVERGVCMWPSRSSSRSHPSGAR